MKSALRQEWRADLILSEATGLRFHPSETRISSPSAISAFVKDAPPRKVRIEPLRFDFGFFLVDFPQGREHKLDWFSRRLHNQAKPSMNACIQASADCSVSASIIDARHIVSSMLTRSISGCAFCYT